MASISSDVWGIVETITLGDDKIVDLFVVCASFFLNGGSKGNCILSGEFCGRIGFDDLGGINGPRVACEGGVVALDPLL
jgi:hypothetical protein